MKNSVYSIVALGPHTHTHTHHWLLLLHIMLCGLISTFQQPTGNRTNSTHTQLWNSFIPLQSFYSFPKWKNYQKSYLLQMKQKTLLLQRLASTLYLREGSRKHGHATFNTHDQIFANHFPYARFCPSEQLSVCKNSFTLVCSSTECQFG